MAALTRDEKILLSRLLEELGHGDRGFFDSLSEHEQRFASQLLREIRKSGECPSLDILWEVDYTERPVPISTFIDDPYFLGSTKNTRQDWIYPAWRECLETMFSPGRRVWELILSGSIGTGKTTIAVVAMLYKVYVLSCMRDPQAFFEMAPGSPIVFGLYNIFKYKVKTTSFATMKSLVDSIPYFREKFPRDEKKSLSIEWPKNISVISGATELHALGENIYGTIIDETDFMRQGATDEEKGQAWSLYTATVRRMESRFLRLGDFPGLLCLISSKTERGSFIEQRIQEKKDDPKVHVEDKPLWEVKPGRYSKETFSVFIGDDYTDPCILTDDKIENPGDMEGKIIQVPIDFRNAFEEDIEAALRDIAGVATVSETPFIPSRSNIFSCIDTSRSHPFTREEFSVTIHDDTVIEDFLDHKKLFDVVRSSYTPRVRPGVSRYIHIDLGITQDAVGFAMGHIGGFKEVTRSQPDGFSYTTKAPVIYIDLMFRVVPTPGSRIDLQKVRDFVYALNQYGFPIRHVSLDGFQSEDSMQQFLKMGFDSSILSMDRPPTLKEGAAYSYFRQAVMENRISYYKYEIFLLEAVHLKRVLLPRIGGGVVRYKVDHPAMMLDRKGRKLRGSKDVADAVGGVVRNCMVLDPAVTEALPPVQGHLQERGAGAKPPPPEFVKNDEWVIGDDYDTSDVVGVDW